ncbi:DnaJ domain-containing protein [Stenotrophomonas sp. C3(2023)]|uniref:J domain-containing protein n=1 Tax=Stenotrophomonas sp. C3(2023) TaxID=3080277 RepID=UPI00293CB908|nr:DnaJ domain-containing protein [Stenotrophomonas sp. C3(2023)]MDV3469068.1 DnaJ domain-containing protein [Stenotrophomonas sp. C3(2023)]
MEKDYYEILGIRPSASQEEISLAYRGRRSQYHPDRYANADAETLAWATSKMKEVNEAHAALSDTDRRAGFDRMRNGRSQSAAGSQRAQPQPEPVASVSLLEVLQAYDPDNDFYKKIHVAPNIPVKKLNGALANYGGGLVPADIVALVDDTVFGGAKEGALITEHEIRIKAILEPPSTIALDKVNKIACARNRLQVNGVEFGKFNVPDDNETLVFFGLVNDFLSRRGASSSNAGSSGAGRAEGTQQNTGLFDVGYYARLDRSIDGQIRAAQGVDQLTLQLVRLLLPISLIVDVWANDEQMPAHQRAFLAGDAVRFEVLTYALAVIQHLIAEGEGPGREHADEIAAALANVMMVACIITLSGFDKKKGLHKMADLREDMRNSGFASEFMRRWARYKHLIASRDDDELGEEFEHSLRWPAMLYMNSLETVSADDLRFINQAVEDVLQSDGVSSLLDELNEEIEGALHEWLD